MRARHDGDRDRDSDGVTDGDHATDRGRRPGAALTALRPAVRRSIEKPPESGGFSAVREAATPGKPCRFAGHRRIALLNDAALAKAFRTSSGRIAQLVEQLTLNQRVPGSSPGAPTKLFKHLAS